jgi:hypothetical protein
MKKEKINFKYSKNHAPYYCKVKNQFVENVCFVMTIHVFSLEMEIVNLQIIVFAQVVSQEINIKRHLQIPQNHPSPQESPIKSPTPSIIYNCFGKLSNDNCLSITWNLYW